jgi:hypothetical protein
MFVAACQALTAKHVVADMHNVNPQWADHMRRQTEGYSWLPYFGSASQVVDMKDRSRSGDWGLTNVWPNQISDLAFLELAPTNEDAIELLNRMAPMFPEWSLLPPPVGAQVVMLGQPRDQAAEGSVATTLTYIGLPATVVENFENRLDRGMYNFPCYKVDREVPHGMSGGPVFWEERFCGVVSGGFFGQTVIASLWPACLTEFENPRVGELSRLTSFSSLFDSGQLRAVDWHKVKGNVSYGIEDGRPVALLRPPFSDRS